MCSADMGELYEMDIKGRTLACTLFLVTNKDMHIDFGVSPLVPSLYLFHFSVHGFWKEHLLGKPYHTSALYVVNLVKFSKSAAEDYLRVFYETLSKDPNSLANLDQVLQEQFLSGQI